MENAPTSADLAAAQIRKVLRDMPQQPQVQFSLEEQLQIAREVCNRFGLYDAADYLKRSLERKR